MRVTTTTLVMTALLLGACAMLALGVPQLLAAPERASAQAIADARGDTWRCQDRIGYERTRAARSARSLATAGSRYRAWVVRVWRKRARGCEKRLRFLTLPETRDWATAVRIAQRVFPGTRGWLLSCSGAEGGHGRWVRYGGGAYYPGYERTDAVGGWMQFRPSTIRDAWPRAYAYTRRRGFQLAERSWFQAWLSPLAQALAAGYYRSIEGSSGHHWSASVGRGC
jgi:hypothetical protein